MTYQFFSARLRSASSSEIRPRLAGSEGWGDGRAAPGWGRADLASAGGVRGRHGPRGCRRDDKPAACDIKDRRTGTCR